MGAHCPAAHLALRGRACFCRPAGYAAMMLLARQRKLSEDDELAFRVSSSESGYSVQKSWIIQTSPAGVV